MREVKIMSGKILLIVGVFFFILGMPFIVQAEELMYLGLAPPGSDTEIEERQLKFAPKTFSQKGEEEQDIYLGEVIAASDTEIPELPQVLKTEFVGKKAAETGLVKSIGNVEPSSEGHEYIGVAPAWEVNE